LAYGPPHPHSRALGRTDHPRDAAIVSLQVLTVDPEPTAKGSAEALGRRTLLIDLGGES
jgi:hypothetical protein